MSCSIILLLLGSLGVCHGGYLRSPEAYPGSFKSSNNHAEEGPHSWEEYYPRPAAAGGHSQGWESQFSYDHRPLEVPHDVYSSSGNYGPPTVNEPQYRNQEPDQYKTAPVSLTPPIKYQEEPTGHLLPVAKEIEHSYFSGTPPYAAPIKYGNEEADYSYSHPIEHGKPTANEPQYNQPKYQEPEQSYSSAFASPNLPIDYKNQEPFHYFSRTNDAHYDTPFRPEPLKSDYPSARPPMPAYNHQQGHMTGHGHLPNNLGYNQLPMFENHQQFSYVPGFGTAMPFGQRCPPSSLNCLTPEMFDKVVETFSKVQKQTSPTSDGALMEKIEWSYVEPYTGFIPYHDPAESGYGK